MQSKCSFLQKLDTQTPLEGTFNHQKTKNPGRFAPGVRKMLPQKAPNLQKGVLRPEGGSHDIEGSLDMGGWGYEARRRRRVSRWRRLGRTTARR